MYFTSKTGNDNNHNHLKSSFIVGVFCCQSIGKKSYYTNGFFVNNNFVFIYWKSNYFLSNC